MPEHYKAFVVIALIAIVVTHLAQPALADIIPGNRLKRWRNIWLGITTIAFLLPTFWLFIIAAILFLNLYAKRQETDPITLYLLLICVIPPLGQDIPGFGIINYFFTLNYVRLLSLVILLPAFITLLHKHDTLRPSATLPDKLLLSFLLLTIGLQLRDTTITDTLRQAFYAFVDVFLPYFVISRSLRTLQQFRSTITALLFSASISAVIGGFEYLKHWLLYVTMSANWQIIERFAYLDRGYSLRATASYGGGPIAFGYGMAIAIGLYFYCSDFIHIHSARRNALLILLMGLFASLSRGPWVGAACMFLVFLATGQHATQRMVRWGMLSVLALFLLPFIPGGEKLINLLPFIGHVDTGTIDYRQQLFHNGFIVIQRNLLFGSVNVLKTPEMLSMRQGQGIIDLVNSYLEIALFYGMVGLSLFSMFFITLLLRINRARRHFANMSESAILGRSLLATLSGILVIIATVSSVGIIPTLYWIIGGIGMAYILLQPDTGTNSSTKKPLIYSVIE